ncbi:hypothetical protein LVJ82_17715 [Vitreoscilla massiliensis]|uniref:Uncharacterized protein n=1 Tax=Vitreoscilla massiliensis TaxID=1689272 RepID=A0ABY4E1L6_9NEIS|nr:hypothetical protein [Vitreoscilla massiliensis]UOO89255.1 hypothetical protein LVJ82_17715 [Vitreoscilla massiliensis]
MSDYWDIDDSTGEIDIDGNVYRNESFRETQDGEIEELTDKGWEYSAMNDFALEFEHDEDGNIVGSHQVDADGNELESFDLNFGDEESFDLDFGDEGDLNW